MTTDTKRTKPPRYDVRVSLCGQHYMSVEQQQDIADYLAPRIAKMIEKDYLKRMPKGYVTAKEWKVRWRDVPDVQRQVEECIDLMLAWKLRWAFESGMAESLIMLAKRYPDEFADIMAKNFFGNAVRED